MYLHTLLIWINTSWKDMMNTVCWGFLFLTTFRFLNPVALQAGCAWYYKCIPKPYKAHTNVVLLNNNGLQSVLYIRMFHWLVLFSIFVKKKKTSSGNKKWLLLRLIILQVLWLNGFWILISKLNNHIILSKAWGNCERGDRKNIRHRV